MFLHYLFLMLVAIHVTLACQCKPMTLLQAMCSKNNNRLVTVTCVNALKHVPQSEKIRRSSDGDGDNDSFGNDLGDATTSYTENFVY